MRLQFFAGAAYLLTVACANEVGPGPVPAGIVAPTSLTVMEGDSLLLDAQVVDEDGQPMADVVVIWGSEDTNIVDISAAGYLRFRNPGYTTVAAIGGGFSVAVNANAALQFSFVAGGNEHRLFYRWCGVTNRNSLWCFPSGNLVTPEADSLIQLSVPPGPAPLQQLAMGYQHMCGVTGDDVGWCWGDNHDGQLGADSAAGGFTIIQSPLPVKGGLRFATVSAAVSHSCGITPEGDAYCWGRGYLGDGVIHSSPATTPVLVAGGNTFVAIAAGSAHTCAITTAGQGYCWGTNQWGQLGVGDSTSSRVEPFPIPVSSGAVLVSISAGQDHTCALANDGTAYCWGSNTWGQLGNLGMGSCYGWRCVAPEAVSTALRFRDLETYGFVNGGATCALVQDGTAYCWGANRAGEVGDGTMERRDLPVPVSGSNRFTSISMGNFNACGMDLEGVVFCWGYLFGLIPQRLAFQPQG